MTEQDPVDGEMKKTWKKISPEVRHVMADVAFRDGALTPGLQDRIQDLALEDVIEEDEGER